VFTDIADRKRSEKALKEYSGRLEEMVEERTRELRETQKELVLKERLAILGQLAGGVSHELRNPLATITNAVYYLQMTLADADEKTQDYLRLIDNQAQTAGKIVSDLLDSSREAPGDRQRTPMPELVAQLWEKRPPPNNVEMTTLRPDNLPPAFIDPHQIGQVLENLVINAYQAMPDGGSLTVRADAKGGRLHLSIADNGVGIPKGHMDKLFEPLFSTKPRGIGLGLAVSKTLLEANGGSIEVASEEGKGSTFTVILPCAEAAD
jgi:signal transduction histidine kinase